MERRTPKKYEGVKKVASICLRCGECCYTYAVQLPDGTVKPERTRCKYYNEENGLGACTIYSSRPKECADFIFPGPGGVCALGQAMQKQKIGGF